MTLCNLCQRKETRNRPFNLPFTCKECESNENNYSTYPDDIIFIDSKGKEVHLNENSDISINLENMDAQKNQQQHDGNIINSENFKDALLASLYTQVEFLKSQLLEKDVLIRTLIINESNSYGKKGYIYQHGKHTNNPRDDECQSHSTENVSSDLETRSQITSDLSEIINYVDEELEVNNELEEDDIFFQNLYKERKKAELDTQLKDIRNEKHNIYNSLKEEKAKDPTATSFNTINTTYQQNERVKQFNTNYHYNEREKTFPNEVWPPNTILILGDSMVNQMDEDRLSASTKKNVKVRSFGGLNTVSIYPKLEPLLKKKPSKIILHIGTNQAADNTSDIIFNNLLDLKIYIESQLDGVTVILSCPITRVDSTKAKLTVNNLTEKIKLLGIKHLLNVNVDENCLGRKGLHLNQRGVGRFAMNLISLIRRL